MAVGLSLEKEKFKQFKEVFGDLSGFEYRLYEGYGHAVYDTAPDFRDRLY